MASNFPAFIAHQVKQPMLHGYTVDPAATFTTGAVVFLDTADNLVKECGVDPALILGIALMPAAQRTLYGGKVLVAVLDPEVVVGMGSATTPADAHLIRPLGIVKSTNWLVDTTEAVNTRLTVVKIDVPNGIFYTKFLVANLQGK